VVKQALKHLLEVPGGVIASLSPFFPDLNKDPSTTQQDPQKCRMCNTAGVHMSVHGPWGVGTAWCPGRGPPTNGPGRDI